ncbi:MAG: C25 family cysteine peptidase [Thermoplasmatota archaeon]
MNSRIIPLLVIAILGASPFLTMTISAGSPESLTFGEPILTGSGAVEGRNTDSTHSHDETIVIDVNYPLARISPGDFGIEIVVEGLNTDPTPGSLRIPREELVYKLPVGTIVDEVRFDFRVDDIPGPDQGISRSPSPIPTNYIEQWDGIEERPDPPSDHVIWDIGTGIDVESGTRCAILSLFVYPVIPREERFVSLRSGRIFVDYHVERQVRSQGIEPVFQEEFDLLVLCGEEFRGTMENYSNYRNLTGTITKVVTLQEIESGSIWQVEGSDLQERIKRFVYNATLAWNIEFLLLVGDADRFPVRHVMVLDGSDDNGASRTDGRFVPSDLYYSDIFEDGTTDFSSWNGPGGVSDLLWGEFDSAAKDDPDLYPDLYVGRIPASTRSELDNMIDKIQGYERSARGSSWFYNATLCGTDTFSGGTPEGEYTSDIIGSSYLSGFNQTKHYQTLGTLSGIASTVNEGCGFFEMSDHGTYTSWAGAYTTTHAYNQRNGYMLPVVVMDACLTHGFDNENASSSISGKDPVFNQYYYAPGASGSGTESVGEQTHRAPDGGAIASFGCTRIGWGAVGNAYPTVLSGYMNTRIHKAYSDGFVRPGQLLASAVTDYRSRHGMGSASGYKTMTEYILLGDPSVYIGGISDTTVEIEPETQEIRAKPGDSVSVNFTLRNTGFLAAPFNITAVPSGSSDHRFYAELNRTDYFLMPDGTSSGQVTITFPEDGLYLEEEEVVLKADSILFSRPRKASIGAIVERVSEVSAEPYPSPIVCDSGASLTGNIRINNLGNGADSFRIKIEDLPGDWEMNIARESVHVDARDFERIHFVMNVSERAPAGRYFIRTMVNSTIGNAENSSMMKVEVRPAYGLDLSVANSTLEVKPDIEGYYNVTLVNTGNSVVEVELDLEPREEGIFLIRNPETDLVMEPFSSLNIPVGVTPVNGTEPRSYPLTLRASDGNSSDEMILTAMVKPKYMFTTSCGDDERVLGESLDVSFDVRITNIGNIRDSYMISSIAENDWIWNEFSGDSGLRIEPGTSANASLFLRTRDLPLQGFYRFRLRIEAMSGVGSQIVPVTVIVRERFDHSLSVELENSSIYPSGSADGELIVNSSANWDDVYIIDGTVPAGWAIDFGSDRLSAPPFKLIPVNFSIAVPKDALAGKYMVDFHVTSIGSNLTRILSKPVFVREVYGIEWSLEGFDNGPLDPGTSANITINIYNRGNVRDRVVITINSWAPKWMILKDSAFFIDPGSNFTTNITVRIPGNATPMKFSLGINIDSIGSGGETRNVTIEVSDPDGSKYGAMPFLTIMIIVLISILMVLILAGVLFANYKKYGGVSVEEAGMEWSEDEEDDWDE